jgi:hypothetical protein
MFAYTTLPLSVWFLGIYCITQSKVSVSALSLKRTIGVSCNTALLMKQKIRQVMKERDDSKPRAQFLQVNQESKRVNSDFPKWVVTDLDKHSKRLGITRQAQVKVFFWDS